ncbi:hypothetical protein C6503_09345 [Candidatus Poribacteria bacterium]|nr:MAG: hypothetical protein C6503_09345 [Candidatus Poribacteria bacterium]
MKKHIQSCLCGLSIWLMLSGWAVSAAPPTAETSDVKYERYPRWNFSEGREYHRFFPTPAPKGHFYNTWMKATANIDDTPEKETIVLIIAETGTSGDTDDWGQAFLLIADETGTGGIPKKKDFFTFFETSKHDFEVPTKAIELHSPPFTFREPPKDDQGHRGVSFEVADLTGDGTLDLWVRFAGNAVAVISFQKGEFRVVFSSYGYHGDQAKACIDLDNDGIYEIKIPHGIYLDTTLEQRPTWINLYEWDGTASVLNNAKFYADNDEFLIQLLRLYNRHLLYERGRLKWNYKPIQGKKYGTFDIHVETYEFYIGLTFYYRGEARLAQMYLQRVAEQGKNENYIQTAETILKKLPPQQR